MRLISVLLVLAGVAVAQWWDGPYQLTTDPGADVNPSVCREWIAWDWQGPRTALVWQSDRNGNGDVFARLYDFRHGRWLVEQQVSGAEQDDCRPAVVCAWDSMADPSFWCAWERLDTGGISVMAARCPSGETLWQAPEAIGVASGDSACLSAIAVPVGFDETTRVRVAWRTQEQGRWQLVTAVHDGDSWGEPEVAVEDSVELKHPRIGRGYRSQQGWYPLLVWERDGDILLSEHWPGGWTTPVEVAPSESLDTNPEVVSCDGRWADWGTWVVWQSRRDGHWALYAVRPDSLGGWECWSQPGSEANDVQPSGTPANFTTDWDLAWVVYATDRNGGSDIYSRGSNEPAVWVDTNPATDVNPCLTTLGWTMLWCVWQSDRTGNQDLFGSFIYWYGIKEDATGGGMDGGGLLPTLARGELFVPRSIAPGHPRALVLVDISGREVMELRAGVNDVRHLGPGVYFVSFAGPGSLPPEMRERNWKVVIAR